MWSLVSRINKTPQKQTQTQRTNWWLTDGKGVGWLGGRVKGLRGADRQLGNSHRGRECSTGNTVTYWGNCAWCHVGTSLIGGVTS